MQIHASGHASLLTPGRDFGGESDTNAARIVKGESSKDPPPPARGRGRPSNRLRRLLISNPSPHQSGQTARDGEAEPRAVPVRAPNRIATALTPFRADVPQLSFILDRREGKPTESRSAMCSMPPDLPGLDLRQPDHEVRSNVRRLCAGGRRACPPRPGGDRPRYTVRTPAATWSRGGGSPRSKRRTVRLQSRFTIFILPLP